MQEQEGEPDDVGICLFKRRQIQKHRQLLLQRLFLHQLLHLRLLKMKEKTMKESIRGDVGAK